MKINGLATIQILDEIADIVLSVGDATTVCVTYDLEGNFKRAELTDEGVPLSFELSSEELAQVMEYIHDNGLKDELLCQIRQ